MDFMDFRKKVATDRSFAAKFSSCASEDELIRAAAAEGYVFTAEDIKNNTVLLDEEMEKATGGINSTDLDLAFSRSMVFSGSVPMLKNSARR